TQEERNMDDKLVSDEVHLRNFSQSPLTQQRRLSTNSNATKTTSQKDAPNNTTPLSRRRCSGGSAVVLGNGTDNFSPSATHKSIEQNGNEFLNTERVKNVADDVVDFIEDDDDENVDEDNLDNDAVGGLSNPAAQINDNDDSKDAQSVNTDNMK
ncbi:uncharacterized transcriptional regulatory protein TBS1-like, partial [Teleopsis dalmanni]